MSRVAFKPYLIAKDEAGAFRVTIRTTRFNSQGYPLVSARQLDDSFATLAQARSYLRQEYQVGAADIATK